MAMPYKFMTAGESEVLPVNGGPYYTDEMSADYGYGAVYVEFFSDAAGTVPATPTAGDVIAEASPMGNLFMASGNVSKILAVNAGSPPMYEPPVFEGCAIKGRLTFSGITGALTCRAIIWRS